MTLLPIAARQLVIIVGIEQTTAKTAKQSRRQICYRNLAAQAVIKM